VRLRTRVRFPPPPLAWLSQIERAENPILRVIELGDQPVRCPPGRRLKLSPQHALYDNSHAGAILEDFEPSDYKAVLREVQRHGRDWETQQTSEQAEWVKQQRRRGYRSTLAAADAILAALKR
jgi:hypothetical protein